MNYITFSNHLINRRLTSTFVLLAGCSLGTLIFTSESMKLATVNEIAAANTLKNIAIALVYYFVSSDNIDTTIKTIPPKLPLTDNDEYNNNVVNNLSSFVAHSLAVTYGHCIAYLIDSYFSKYNYIMRRLCSIFISRYTLSKGINYLFK